MGKKLLTTDSTLSGYIIMSIVCTLYVYQESALNHMFPLWKCIVWWMKDSDLDLEYGLRLVNTSLKIVMVMVVVN